MQNEVFQGNTLKHTLSDRALLLDFSGSFEDSLLATTIKPSKFDKFFAPQG